MVIHRWVKEGPASLLVLGFNQSPVMVTLRDPPGMWQLSVGSMAKEFGGTGQDSMPTHLVVSPQGTSVAIPAYTAAVFIAS